MLSPLLAPIALGALLFQGHGLPGRLSGAIASACGAKRFFLLTDVPGVLSKDGDLLTDLDAARVAALKDDGTIKGGMIPKVETCVKAVANGVDAAVILDGRIPHGMLLEIFTRQGVGTLVHD
jgi:acetylglutamate kinase